MLDPAAIADASNYAAKDIAAPLHPPHQDQPRGHQRDRREMAGARPLSRVPLPRSPAEEAVFEELTRTWLADPSAAPGAGTDRRLFPYTLLKTFLSSHKALRDHRAASRAKQQHRRQPRRLRSPASPRSPTRSPTTTPRSSPPWSASSSEIGVGPHSPTRAVVFSESRSHPRMAARDAAAPPRPHRERRTRSVARCTAGSPTPGSRRSSSSSRSPTRRSGSCSPATSPPRA